MPGERPGPSENEFTSPGEGWVGAHEEKPLRDAARPEKSKNIEISPEEKHHIDSTAKKYGEAAIQEYRTEQERSLLQKLKYRIKELQLLFSSEQAEPQNDKEIASQIEQRINIWVQLAISKKESIPARELAVRFGTIPVTYRLGKKGGAIYDGGGLSERLLTSATGQFSDQALEQPGARPAIQRKVRDGKDFISSKFSEPGETAFYRALGALKENETLAGLNKAGKLDPQKKFTAEVKTGIEGVTVLVTNDPSKQEEGIFLKFSPEFIQQMLSE